MLLLEIPFADEIVWCLRVAGGTHGYIALVLIVLFLVWADLG